LCVFKQSNYVISSHAKHGQLTDSTFRMHAMQCQSDESCYFYCLGFSWILYHADLLACVCTDALESVRMY